MIIELKDLPKDRAIQKINFEIIFDSSGEVKEINTTNVPEIPNITELKQSSPAAEKQETRELSSNALGVDTNRPPKIDDDIMKMEF